MSRARTTVAPAINWVIVRQLTAGAIVACAAFVTAAIFLPAQAHDECGEAYGFCAAGVWFRGLPVCLGLAGILASMLVHGWVGLRAITLGGIAGDVASTGFYLIASGFQTNWMSLTLTLFVLILVLGVVPSLIGYSIGRATVVGFPGALPGTPD